MPATVRRQGIGQDSGTDNARVNSANVHTQPTSSRGKRFWKTKRSPQPTDSRESDAHSKDRSERGILGIILPAKAKERLAGTLEQSRWRRRRNTQASDDASDRDSGNEQDGDDELPSDHGDSDAHEAGWACCVGRRRG